MLLAISTRVTENTSYPETRDSLAHDWPVWLDGAGHLPIYLPNRLQNPKAFLSALKVEGLILTGGDSVTPTGDDMNCRDTTERAAIETAIEDSFPIIGICRGLQMLNHVFGGEIVRDIPANVPASHSHVAQSHPVELLGPFAELAGRPQLMVNSFHNEGVVPQGLAPDLKPFALSDDGLIEGIVHPDLPILAIQWHPERSGPDDNGFIKTLLNKILTEGAFWKGRMK